MLSLLFVQSRSKFNRSRQQVPKAVCRERIVLGKLDPAPPSKYRVPPVSTAINPMKIRRFARNAVTVWRPTGLTAVHTWHARPPHRGRLGYGRGDGRPTTRGHGRRAWRHRRGEGTGKHIIVEKHTPTNRACPGVKSKPRVRPVGGGGEGWGGVARGTIPLIVCQNTTGAIRTGQFLRYSAHYLNWIRFTKAPSAEANLINVMV